MNGYERLYQKLEIIIPDLATFHGAKTLTTQSTAYMDLHVDVIHDNQDGSRTISLAHHYEQHGDLIPDPDMTIKVLPSARMAQALSYQDMYGRQEVYPKPGYVNLRIKKDLNRFLEQWLKNLKAQGHQEGAGKEPRR